MPERCRAHHPTFGPSMARALLPFHAVNRRGTAEFDPSLQRHHLLPQQLLGTNCFSTLFKAVGIGRIGFNDFRANGMLLPATGLAALRTGMPLHRGPHPRYNEVVIERVGTIERQWSCDRMDPGETATRDAVFRLRLLQRALRRRLMSERRRLVLNRKDPLGKGYDFTTLDAMAEAIWREA